MSVKISNIRKISGKCQGASGVSSRGVGYFCGKTQTQPMKRMKSMRKGLVLRISSLAGLTIVCVSLLLSAGWLSREFSYDRHHAKAERIFRLSLVRSDGNRDVRIYGYGTVAEILRRMPEVEAAATFLRFYVPEIEWQGRHLESPGDVFAVDDGFFRVFDIPMCDGNEAGGRPGAYVSDGFAEWLEGVSAVRPGGERAAETGDLTVQGRSYPVAGIFRRMPETSHFHPAVLLRDREYDAADGFRYVYLLLSPGTDPERFAGKLSEAVAAAWSEAGPGTQPGSGTGPGSGTVEGVQLMPLTDIHLRGDFVRELENNGSIVSVYLIVCANLLLAAVVLFSLWLNQRLLFSAGERDYRLRRILGAPVSVVIGREAVQAVLLCLCAVVLALPLARTVFRDGTLPGTWSPGVAAAVLSVFSVLSVLTALLPALTRSGRLGTAEPGALSGNFARRAGWIFVLQYGVVLVVLIAAVGMRRQMRLVERIQPGGADGATLVLRVRSDGFWERYPAFRDALRQYPGIEGVTTAFQLPGEAIRDAVSARLEGTGEWVRLPVLVAGEDFLPFFGIPLAAGRAFSANRRTHPEEVRMLEDRFRYGPPSGATEEYVINRKALHLLGFRNPDEALGRRLALSHGVLDYIAGGTIVGVAEDFPYTGTFEETEPLLILQRSLFHSCILVRTDPDRTEETADGIRRSWETVYPDRVFPGYVRMQDVFRSMYANEMNAVRLTGILTLFCLLVSNLSLVIFIACVVDRRRKEIALRKVHGATVRDLLVLLNRQTAGYLAAAFAAAVPVSALLLSGWQERFAYRTGLEWWVFAAALAAVGLLSAVSVSLRCLGAVSEPPLRGIGAR